MVQEDLKWLQTTAAVRSRSQQMLELARENKLKCFTLQEDRLEFLADQVAEITKKNYPNLKIPFHSRWRHLSAGGIDRGEELRQEMAGLSSEEKLRVSFDLMFISVLLDAGAGPQWSFRDAGRIYRRSEGLAVASWQMFRQGVFSSTGEAYRVDAQGLTQLTVEHLARGLRVSERNPLTGLEGRVGLLNRLGQAAKTNSVFQGSFARPGCMADRFHSPVDATSVMEQVLKGLKDVWPARMEIDGIQLGDVWSHPLIQGAGVTNHLVPFHKLSQWLTYSLIETLMEYGVRVDGLDQMTGLAEYRNGGLFVDSGVLEVKSKQDLQVVHQPDSEMIVEWRSMTVALLDVLRPLVEDRLQVELPLACMLEGGTWALGRQLANEKRGGPPPIQTLSDGTIF
ncbi:MAG: DUF1688 family protein [Oligoflexales bacterium]